MTIILALLAALAMSALAVPARAAMTADEVAAAIAETYGVKVLRVADGEFDGRAVYRVTVMRGGGDANGAWAVTTVMVDAESGELVPQFRHRESGYDLSGAPQNRVDQNRPDAAESGFVWR